jgi:bacterioferritin
MFWTWWFRDQARESLDHADQAGEWVTNFDGHPSLKIGELLETHQHSIRDILQETLAHEEGQCEKYKKLLKLVENKHIALEEYARTMIFEEDMHLNEVRKMMRSMEK